MLCIFSSAAWPLAVPFDLSSWLVLESVSAFLGPCLVLAGGKESLFTVHLSVLVFLRHCLCVPFFPTLISLCVSRSLYSFLGLKCLSPFGLLSAVFTHLISQMLRDQNQLHFVLVHLTLAPLTACRKREMDSIRVAVCQEDQFHCCQEYFIWLISVFNTVGKLSSIISSPHYAFVLKVEETDLYLFVWAGRDQSTVSKGSGSAAVTQVR